MGRERLRAARLHLQALEFFPVTGSITYLGYFHEDEAREYARSLQSEGLDVDVRGAAAYSTLGFFEDSILSSMIARDEDDLGQLADVVLHESLHATFFVSGQSVLNESVAAFAGRELATEYLTQTRGAESAELVAYLRGEALDAQRGHVLREAYSQLSTLYASPLPESTKLAAGNRPSCATLARGLGFDAN